MSHNIELNLGTLFSPRQGALVLWTALGKTTEEAAMIEGIAKSTAKTHLDIAAAKLHAHNKAQLVANAFLGGYLRKTTACLVLAMASLLSAVQPDSGTDQVRNFRQTRRSGSRKDKLHPSLWDIDYA